MGYSSFTRMSSNEPPAEELGSSVISPPSRLRVYWPIFLGLIGPAIISILAVRYGTWYAAPNVTIFSSIAGGVVCTLFSVLHRPIAVWKKLLLALVLLPVYSLASLIIAMFGCSIAGSTR